MGAMLKRSALFAVILSLRMAYDYLSAVIPHVCLEHSMYICMYVVTYIYVYIHTYIYICLL